DGDSDAYEPLQNLINKGGFWGGSQHGLCAWHKMLGWTKVVMPTLGTDNAKRLGKMLLDCAVLFGHVIAAHTSNGSELFNAKETSHVIG
ncbi:MAG: hypothetical protein ACRDL7_05975, partial [Gaiellaceae bacterium]